MARGQQAPGEAPTSLRLVPKPVDDTPEHRARQQPTVPSAYTEMPFVETTAEPALTPEEKQRGYVLFHRSITEPVYPNTKPLAQERLEQLTAFATPGEFEPLTFSLYPVRDLQNLKVRCSSLTCEAGAIPTAAITVRLVTYWNVGYPRYTSRSTYRRTPELLERVSVHSSPQGECQRYWIQVHVPEGTKPGLYRGTVSVWDDGFEQAVEIPVSLRVLGFKLQKDPAKHYSAYYYVRNRSQYAGKLESFVRTAAANEYRAMVEYGLDMTPTLSFGSKDGKTIYLPYADELEQMLKAGLTGPVPVTADSVIGRFYRETTPGGAQGSHWNINQLPPPEFYERITAAFKAFESERKTKGWPEFICCPIDEVAAARKEFGAQVYAAVKAAGIRTYATKDPTGADADTYRRYIDIWCSQPYSVPYEKIVGQDRYEYWCYPNHNAGEIKDRLVMCKGGRMTYGFGFWRSGYTTLIPWHWSWTPGTDQFDYLRGAQSGCGQRIDEDGEVIPAVYWECFREGIDDARYIYTLQQALFQREGSPDAQCGRVVAGARKLLQDTWDAIHVQQKYLADGMWPSEEFNTRRWLLAQATSELLPYPAVRTGSAPSVLVTNTAPRPAQPETSNSDKALQAGNTRSTNVGGASAGLDKYPFFPFCIDWHDAKKRSFEQQAQMLKELGYPGVGHIWLDNVEERIKTLDATGLKLFQITMAVEVAPAKTPYDVDRFKGVCAAIRGRGVQFCLLLNGMKPSDPTVDAHAVDILRAMSDEAKASGAQLLLYPHQSSWVERIEDAIRVADKVDRPNVGVMFNLCHWLRVDSSRDYRPLLKRALPRLWAVSINGADEFDEKPGWERYIQPLDRGSFDAGKLLATLKELGYQGPIGLQCYGIGGDAREHLARSLAAWQKLSRNLKD